MNKQNNHLPGAMVVAMALMLFIAPMAHAVSTITVSSTGDGIFTVQGAAMEGVAAMDLVLRYDATALANPKVEQGGLLSGAMMAANPNIPGVVRIAIIRTTPITGSGLLLTVTFGRIGNATGSITDLAARFSDLNGKALPVSVQLVKPAESTSPTTDTFASQQAASQPNAPAAEARAALPPVIMPVEVKKPATSDQSQQKEQAVIPSEQSAAANEPVAAKEVAAKQTGGAEQAGSPAKGKKVYTQKSVLELFQEYKGPRTQQALLALFDREPMIGFKQSPRIAIADGLRIVTVTFISMTTEKNGPVVSLKGVRQLSLAKDTENTNTWIATVKPEKGVSTASIRVSQENSIMEFPLIVAPKVTVGPTRSRKVTGTDFTRYLQGPKGKNTAGFDLNGDGEINYLDDYIFTANYLASLPVAGSTVVTKNRTEEASVASPSLSAPPKIKKSPIHKRE